MNSKVPLSQCRFWPDLRSYYREQGIGAWQQDVPCYATSNPYIAHAYARIIWQYVQEAWPAGPPGPIRILELGAGSGTFAFHCVKRLLELQYAQGLEHLRFSYLMTDGAQKNVEFWRSHPALGAYARHGCLDFVHQEISGEADLGSLIEQLDLVTGAPLIVLANYLFDSLPHDVFYCAGDRLQECLIDRQPRRINADNNQCVSLDRIDPGLGYRDINMPYYGNPELDQLLLGYALHVVEGHFLIPIGALRCLQGLRRVHGDDFLLIASDKAFGKHARLFTGGTPEVAFHGDAISMSVNFEALGHYVQQIGGDVHYQSTHQSLSTAVFAPGRRFRDLPRTQAVLMHELSASGPGILFNCYQHVGHTHEQCSLEMLVSYLHLTYWDPSLFDVCIRSLLRHLENVADASVAQGLIEHLPLVRANFYYRPGY